MAVPRSVGLRRRSPPSCARRKADARGVLADAEVPHAVDDTIAFIEQKEVPVPSHQLDDKLHLDRVVKLVTPGQGEDRDAVQARLLNGDDAAADEILS